MQIFLSQNLKNYVLILILAGVLLALLFWGVNNGKKQAESKLVLQESVEIISALNFFYSDNNRFPAVDEFTRPEIMQSYFSSYPQNIELSSDTCTKAFSYSRPQNNSYELNFCLTANEGGYKTGWNQIKK